MESGRYYLAGLCLAIVATTSPASTQSAAPPAAANCSSAASPVTSEPDSAALLKRLVDCGYELNADSEYQRSRGVFDRAIAMATRLADRASLAAALAGYGGTLRAEGKGAEAEPHLLESLRIGEAIQDQDAIAQASSQLARLRSMQARYDEARQHHARSFELWNAIGNKQGAAVAINNVGAMYRAVGDYETAQQYYRRSLDILEQLGDRRRSATVLDNMGSVARHLGDYAEGLALTQKAFAIREALNDRLGIANGLDSLSVFHEADGNYAAALAALQKSLEIRRSLGAAHGTAEALNNIAAVYRAQGDYEQAVAYVRRALTANEQVGSRSLLASLHTHLGELLDAQGRDADALASLNRSLGISRPAGYKIQLADALYAIGRLHLGHGRTSPAAEALEECLSLRESSGERRGQAETLIELAEVALRRKDLARARVLAAQAEELARTMELPDVRWRASTTVGRVAVAMGQRMDAARAFDEAITLVEDLRLNVAGGNETRSRFFADRLAPYRERIALAFTNGRPIEAFSIAERSKARVLLDVMHTDRLPAGVTTLTEAERTRETALRRSMSSVNTEIALAAQAASPDVARLETLRRRRAATRLEFEDFQAALYASHPELRIRRGAVQTVTAEEAVTLVSTPTAAIIEFVVGAQRVWAFAIQTSGTRTFELPVSPSELTGLVERFRDQLAARDLRAPETARQIHARVLAPMQDVLTGKTDVTIVPDGVLWNLPFQALRSASGRYLIEDAAISYAPSVTVLRETMRLRRASSSPTLLAFGNPRLGGGEAPLPDAETQVNQLGKVYGGSSRVYVGADASEARWKAEASRHDVLHLASHGVVDNRSPLYSYVALARAGAADDGLVEAWELMTLSLKASLVVLSACETARGRISPGEGVIGLMWAALVAGAPATLVSQWKVDSSSSTTLMVGFHTVWNGGRSGVSKARALQRASLELLRSRDSAHPFYWAGFILAGNPS